MRQLQSSAICLGPCGLMDKAPASGAGDSAFESRLGQCSFFCVLRTWADVARRPRPPCEVSHRSVQFGGVGGRRRGGMRCFSANCQKKKFGASKISYAFAYAHTRSPPSDDFAGRRSSGTRRRHGVRNEALEARAGGKHLHARGEPPRLPTTPTTRIGCVPPPSPSALSLIHI